MISNQIKLKTNPLFARGVYNPSRVFAANTTSRRRIPVVDHYRKPTATHIVDAGMNYTEPPQTRKFKRYLQNQGIPSLRFPYQSTYYYLIKLYLHIIFIFTLFWCCYSVLNICPNSYYKNSLLLLLSSSSWSSGQNVCFGARVPSTGQLMRFFSKVASGLRYRSAINWIQLGSRTSCVTIVDTPTYERATPCCSMVRFGYKRI